MRQALVSPGASELSYEIREIIIKADQLAELGRTIYFENIGDPIQKNWQIPSWIKDIISELAQNDKSYGYSHSMGEKFVRQFLAEENNKLKGAKISAEDIIFFNGLGDGISTLYQFIKPTSRIIGPSPAYSTHSSGEAAHANANPITYQLNPAKKWLPEMDDLYNQVQYNPSIVGILIINPDNPTGAVYPRKVLEDMVKIAREFDLFLLCDEIYGAITYNGAKHYPLSEVIEDLPGIAMKGMSKDMPWPGSRCGWMEFYNRGSDALFNKLFHTLQRAKMLEVCSTTLPQMAIPKVYGHKNYPAYRKATNEKIGKRSSQIAALLQDIPYLYFNETFGAFYNTIIFKPGTINSTQKLKIDNPEVEKLLDGWLQERNLKADKRFVYYLLAAKGVCVVPISSFCSDLLGFRVTLLEENEDLLIETFTHIKEAVIEYCES
ncbi:pyridoxal phosphate-dependent aminotransferase [Roseivirga pacifica]|uniref:pyridoxal phosphate-dependent aminotransferase n=1 Tax=Roseivirga pacifica TaxID=1267423 RepID=UPI00227BA502|nr:pyridoxal phosphate-dependent aminotransferase [Roseivirga pacifica]